jgi:hypothetical protein
MNEITFRLIYLVVGVTLSACVLWRVHRSGQMLLTEKLDGSPQLVRLMSHAVSAGCVLVMFGYIAVSGWPLSGLSSDTRIFFELELQKIGYLCIALGIVCFFHVFLVTRIGRSTGRRDLRRESMPV